MDYQDQKEYRESEIEIKKERNPSYHDYMNPYVNTMVTPSSSSSRLQKEYHTRERKEYKSSSSPKKFGEVGLFHGFPKPESIRKLSRSYIRPEDECPLLADSTPKLKKEKKKNMKLPKYLDDEEVAATALPTAEGGGGSSIFYRDCSQRGSFKYASTFSSNPHAYFNDAYADPLDLIKQSSPTLTEKFKKDTRGAISIEKRKNRNRGSREEGYFEDEAKIKNFDIFEPRDVYEEPETFIINRSSSSSSEKQRSRVRSRARVHAPREETLVESPSLPPKLPPKKIINQHSSVLLPPPPIPPHLISTSRRREIRESGGGGGGGGGGVVRERNFKKQLPTGDNNNFKSTTFRSSSTSRKNYNKTRHDNDEEDPRRLREKNVFKLLSDTMRMKLKVKENFEK